MIYDVDANRWAYDSSFLGGKIIFDKERGPLPRGNEEKN